MWFLDSPRSSFAGSHSGAVTLRALDLNGEQDAPILVARLKALGVRASVQTARRDGATLTIAGASDIQGALDAVMPQMRIALWSEATAGGTGRTKLLDTCGPDPCQPVLVDTPPALTGRSIRGAALADDHGPTIRIDFTPDGALQLEALTQRTIGHRVVLTADDAIYSAAIVQERITGGTLVLTLGAGANRQAAEALVAGMVTGAMSGRWELIALE